LVREVRIYAEGGGDSRDAKAFLREGFSAFLSSLNSMAREKGVRWHIVTCGAGIAAFDAFRTARTQHPEAFNVLLVDSEAPVQTTPWTHLHDRDGWATNGLSDDCCHLMTQAMEAWFVADITALATFYGQGFHPAGIPRNPDVEQVPKAQLETSLRDASRHTLKGEYHKTRHAWMLLRLIDPEVVRRASLHCERLFTTLQAKMQ
jgi:hypothetical protein